MPYATTSELADYLGIDEADLPGDADRLLERASELIDYYVLPNSIDTTETYQEEAARKATMAQYEYWSELGDELGITSRVESISISKFSVSSSGDEGPSLTELAPRAKQALIKVGLFSRGVDMR